MAVKFLFNLKQAGIYQAIKWNKSLLFRILKICRKLFLIFFIFIFLIFLYGFIAEVISFQFQKITLGLSIILFVFYLISCLEEIFFNTKLKKPKLPAVIEEVLSASERFNLAEFLSFDAAQIIDKTIRFCRQKKNIPLTATALFYNLIDNKKLSFVFNRALLNNKEIKKFVAEYFKTIAPQSDAEFFYTPDFQETIFESLNLAKEKNHQRLEIGDLITALAKTDLIFKKILVDYQLKFNDIKNLVRWLEKLEEETIKQKRFWEWNNLVRKGSLGREWVAGYTPTLDKFSTDISVLVKKRNFPEIIGHQEEIKSMERILARTEINNVLIVGEAGSGRKSMIYALAKKSLLGESLPELNYKRVVQLDLTALLTQLASLDEIESILDAIFREVLTAGNVILVIDEIHNFIGGGAKLGAIDISNILASYLASPAFPIVAITTFEGLHKNLEQNSSILSLFEKVEVAEISLEETLELLQNLSLVLEQKNKRFVSYQALRDIIAYCDKYLPAIPFPEKAMDLLDEAMIYLNQTKEKVLLSKHIAEIFSKKTQIPVGEIEEKERKVLLNLEKLIHERIINQEEAVMEVATALRRARTKISVRKGPMGCFLFLGPTGVGKTETSKALAEIYFGSEERIIRLDMSEFQNINDIPRLLGAPGQEGLLTTPVREQPFSLILLDELEKAHPNILNLFLQVFDEGHLTDGLGRKVDFKNSIIIATSNAGYQIILQALSDKNKWVTIKKDLLDYLFREGIFRPEFINRFDAVVIFKPLTQENLLLIADLLFKKLKQNLKEKEIELVIAEPLKKKIVELGYDPVFGARQMRRVIQDKIENVLAQAILSGEIKRGYRVEINPENFQLQIK
ncbi:MAG: AAA family ATPase [Minisyncoccales bacterium]